MYLYKINSLNKFFKKWVKRKRLIHLNSERQTMCAPLTHGSRLIHSAFVVPPSIASLVTLKRILFTGKNKDPVSRRMPWSWCKSRTRHEICQLLNRVDFTINHALWPHFWLPYSRSEAMSSLCAVCGTIYSTVLVRRNKNIILILRGDFRVSSVVAHWNDYSLWTMTSYFLVSI